MGEIAVTKKDQKGELSGFLNSPELMDSFKTVLPTFLTPVRLVKAALIAASKTPKLYQCTKPSIATALIRAAELGLDCSGTLGQGYLIPYGDQCQFITGYQGLVTLCRRSGELADIYAEVVYQNEYDTGNFQLEYGLNRNLIHRPTMVFTKRDDSEIIGAYVVTSLKDGTRSFTWMSRGEIDSIRARSRAGNNGPWVTDFPAMCKKTVIRRHMKLLPMSVEVFEQVEREDDVDFEQNKKAVASSVVETLKPTVKAQPEPEQEQPAQDDPQPISQDLPFSDPEPQHQKPEEKPATDDAGRRQELGRIVAEIVQNNMVIVNNRDTATLETEEANDSMDAAELFNQSIAALSEFKSPKDGRWVNGKTSIDALADKRLEITLRKARDIYTRTNAA